MTINISSKDGLNQIIFKDKICHISQSSSGTIIGLVSGTNIIVSMSPVEVLRLVNSKP